MEFFKPGHLIDFMRLRNINVTISAITFVLSIVLFIYPGPNWGIDFRGGTELQLKFKGHVDASAIRSALGDLGYRRPEVISVSGKRDEYILRLDVISALSPARVHRIRQRLLRGIGHVSVKDTKISPGGDKIALTLGGSADPAAIQRALEEAGARVRQVLPFGHQGEHRYEAQLIGVADDVVHGLQRKMGSRGPEDPLRVEWVGPKAGAQLRDAGIKSLLYAMAFIMVYVALRFDLRFAPGGVIAMLHDAIITAGILVILQKELTLVTVAALLTIVGYSVNDTIVVYDRIRENMHRMRQKTLHELINISTSDTLSRTILTSGVTMLSMVPFFVLGTPLIRDFAMTMVIGILIGTYSSIYVAAPVTEWIDNRFFAK